MSEMSRDSETDIKQKKANPKKYVKGIDKRQNINGKTTLAYMTGERKYSPVKDWASGGLRMTTDKLPPTFLKHLERFQ